MSNELIVLLEGREVGRVRKNARGGINFLYDDGWRKDPRSSSNVGGYHAQCCLAFNDYSSFNLSIN